MRRKGIVHAVLFSESRRVVRDGNGMYGTDLGALLLKELEMRFCVGDSGSSPLTDEKCRVCMADV